MHTGTIAAGNTSNPSSSNAGAMTVIVGTGLVGLFQDFELGLLEI